MYVHESLSYYNDAVADVRYGAKVASTAEMKKVDARLRVDLIELGGDAKQPIEMPLAWLDTRWIALNNKIAFQQTRRGSNCGVAPPRKRRRRLI